MELGEQRQTVLHSIATSRDADGKNVCRLYQPELNTANSTSSAVRFKNSLPESRITSKYMNILQQLLSLERNVSQIVVERATAQRL